MVNKRAVSEVVGALIMITLAVVAGIVVYVYASGLMGPLEGVKVQQPYIEKITLDYYQWSTVSGPLILMLRNIGSAQLTLALSMQDPCCFIAGQPVTATFTDLSNTPPGCSSSNLNVNAGACQVMLTYTNATITRGVAYDVRVVTSDGAIFDFSCIAGATS